MFHLIMGLPGTGKTAAAEFLVEKLSAMAIRLDPVYSALFPIQGEQISDSENTRRLEAAYLEMCNIVPGAHRKYPKTHIVVEGVFRSAEQRQNITNAIIEAGADCSALLVTARREIARERVQTRHAAGDSACNLLGYEKARAEFEELRMPHRIIDNYSSIAEMHNLLENYLSDLARQDIRSAPARESRS